MDHSAGGRWPTLRRLAKPSSRFYEGTPLAVRSPRVPHTPHAGLRCSFGRSAGRVGYSRPWKKRRPLVGPALCHLRWIGRRADNSLAMCDGLTFQLHFSTPFDASTSSALERNLQCIDTCTPIPQCGRRVVPSTAVPRVYANASVWQISLASCLEKLYNLGNTISLTQTGG